MNRLFPHELPPFPELLNCYQRGQFALIAELASRCLDARGNIAIDLQRVELIAVSCAQVGAVDDAGRLFESLCSREPGNTAYRANLAVFWMQIGRVSEARALLEECCRRKPVDESLHFNLGLACFAESDFPAAVRTLAPVVEALPDHLAARLYLARAHMEIGNIGEVHSLAADFDFAGLDGLRERYERSRLCTGIDQPEKAEAILHELLQAYPDEDFARINLAGLLERANKISEAQAILDGVSDATRGTAPFHSIQAKLLAANKDHESALEEFAAADAAAVREFSGPALMQFQSDIEFGRGHALDKLRRYDEAHEALVRANTLIRDHFRHYHPARTDEGFRVPGLVDRPDLDAPVTAASSEASSASADSPIFLVGFPRSGTTLLDQILDAHPSLQVLEEKPALDAVAAAMASLPMGYPDSIAGLDAREAEKLRTVYWQTVARYLPRKPGTRLVDKYPLNLARIHMAMRLFPQAQWIFAIRHPCDVVLSCFMQNFRFTESTHGFWSIEQTASIYEQIMSLWLAQRERLQPDCLDLRYEDLVADFEPNARRLIGFLKLPWDEGVLRYNEHAKTRRISTPSYNQVVEPIYRTAAGRWRNYEKWFGAALPMLQPFIEKLGYAE